MKLEKISPISPRSTPHYLPVELNHTETSLKKNIIIPPENKVLRRSEYQQWQSEVSQILKLFQSNNGRIKLSSSEEYQKRINDIRKKFVIEPYFNQNNFCHSFSDCASEIIFYLGRRQINSHLSRQESLIGPYEVISSDIYQNSYSGPENNNRFIKHYALAIESIIIEHINRQKSTDFLSHPKNQSQNFFNYIFSALHPDGPDKSNQPYPDFKQYINRTLSINPQNFEHHTIHRPFHRKLVELLGMSIDIKKAEYKINY